MKDRIKRIPLSVIAGLSVAAITCGGAVAFWALNSKSPEPQNTTNLTSPPVVESQPPVVQTQPPVVPSPPPVVVQPEPQVEPTVPKTEKRANVYVIKDKGKNLELLPESVKVASNNPDAILTEAFQSLLTKSDKGSAIPAGTKLLGVQVKDDGVHVNLSQEYVSGGGSASVTGRVGQVVYTATTLQPTAKVWINVEGKRLDVLGGEGLEVEQPLTRASFKKNYPL